MEEYKIQLRDKHGNKQYPVTSTMLVIGPDGKTVEERLKQIHPSAFAFFDERTAFPTKLIAFGSAEDVEISEEERAYNKETLDMVWEQQRGVLIASEGLLMQLVVAVSNNDVCVEATFNSTFADESGIMTGTMTINSDGDAIYEVKLIPYAAEGLMEYVDQKIKEAITNVLNTEV